MALMASTRPHLPLRLVIDWTIDFSPAAASGAVKPTHPGSRVPITVGGRRTPAHFGPMPRNLELGLVCVRPPGYKLVADGAEQPKGGCSARVPESSLPNSRNRPAFRRVVCGASPATPPPEGCFSRE